MKCNFTLSGDNLIFQIFYFCSAGNTPNTPVSGLMKISFIAVPKVKVRDPHKSNLSGHPTKSHDQHPQKEGTLISQTLQQVKTDIELLLDTIEKNVEIK